MWKTRQLFKSLLCKISFKRKPFLFSISCLLLVSKAILCKIGGVYCSHSTFFFNRLEFHKFNSVLSFALVLHIETGRIGSKQVFYHIDSTLISSLHCVFFQLTKLNYILTAFINHFIAWHVCLFLYLHVFSNLNIKSLYTYSYASQLSI